MPFRRSASWRLPSKLAAVSALIAIVLYDMGAREAAVIELGVGAGLTTVLFAFAIGVVSQSQHSGTPVA